MNTLPRPSSSQVSAQPPVSAPVTTSAAIVPTPQPARPASKPELDDEPSAQAKRDFYAWCDGCAGYGSIF